MDMMFQVIERGMKRWKQFTMLDIASFKLYLFSIGVLFGMHVADKRVRLAPLFGVAAFLSFCHIAWRIFGREPD